MSAVLERDEEMPSQSSGRDRRNGYRDELWSGAEHLDTFQAYAHILLPRLFKSRPQVQGHVVPQHPEQIQFCFARVGSQITPHVATKLDDAVLVIDDHRRRRILGRQQTIYLPLERA